MLRDGEPWFIDYQGGRRGALQYDVASLLYDPKVGLTEPLARGAAGPLPEQPGAAAARGPRALSPAFSRLRARAHHAGDGGVRLPRLLRAQAALSAERAAGRAQPGAHPGDGLRQRGAAGAARRLRAHLRHGVAAPQARADAAGAHGAHRQLQLQAAATRTTRAATAAASSSTAAPSTTPAATPSTPPSAAATSRWSTSWSSSRRWRSSGRACAGWWKATWACGSPAASARSPCTSAARGASTAPCTSRSGWRRSCASTTRPFTWTLTHREQGRWPAREQAELAAAGAAAGAASAAGVARRGRHDPGGRAGHAPAAAHGPHPQGAPGRRGHAHHRAGGAAADRGRRRPADHQHGAPGAADRGLRPRRGTASAWRPSSRAKTRARWRPAGHCWRRSRTFAGTRPSFSTTPTSSPTSRWGRCTPRTSPPATRWPRVAVLDRPTTRKLLFDDDGAAGAHGRGQGAGPARAPAGRRGARTPVRGHPRDLAAHLRAADGARRVLHPGPVPAPGRARASASSPSAWTATPGSTSAGRSSWSRRGKPSADPEKGRSLAPPRWRASRPSHR